MRQQYFGGSREDAPSAPKSEFAAYVAWRFRATTDAVHVFGGQFKISPERVTQQFAEVRNCKWCALLRSARRHPVRGSGCDALR